MGDFNSIVSQSENIGGLHFASSSNNNFSSTLNNLALINLGFRGYPFTWNNKRAGLENIQQRIDRLEILIGFLFSLLLVFFTFQPLVLTILLFFSIVLLRLISQSLSDLRICGSMIILVLILSMRDGMLLSQVLLLSNPTKETKM